MSLIDVDPAPLKGRVVRGGHAPPAAAPASRACAGSRSAAFGAEWVEGTSADYEPQAGSSTHNHRRHPDVPWTVPRQRPLQRDPRPGRDDLAHGRRLAARRATAGRRSPSTRRSSPPAWPGSATGSSCSTTPARSGPATASKFTPMHMPNRFVYSRESEPASAPYLTVDLGAEDRAPPAAPARPDGRGRRPAGRRGVGLVDDARATRGRPGRSASSSTRRRQGRPALPDPAGRRGRAARADAPARPRPGAGRRGHARGPRRGRRRATSGRRPRRRSRVSDRDGRSRCPGEPPTPFAGRRPRCRGWAAPRSRSSTSWTRSQPVTGDADPRRSPTAISRPTTSGTPRRSGSACTRRGTSSSASRSCSAAPATGVRPTLDVRGRRRRRRSGSSSAATGTSRPKQGAAARPDRAARRADGRAPTPGRQDPEPARRGLRPARRRGRRPQGHADAEGRRRDARARRHAAGLGLHPARLPELPARDELLRPARRTSATTTGWPTGTGRSSTACPTTTTARVADGCAPTGTARRSTGRPGTGGSAPTSTARPSPTCPRKGVPIECFYLPMFENWPTPMEGNYNGDYWADRAFPDALPPRLRRGRRGSSPSTSTPRAGTTRSSSASSTARSTSRRNGWSRGHVPLAARRAGELPGLLGPALLRPRPSTRGSTQAPRPGEAGLPLRHLPPAVAARRARRPARLQRRRRRHAAATGGSSSTARRPRARSSSSTAAANADRGLERPAGRLVASTPGRSAPTASCPGRRSATPSRGRRPTRSSLFYPGRDGDGRAGPVDPPQGVPPRPAGRRVPDPLRPGDGRAALGGRPSGSARRSGWRPSARGRAPAARTRA